MNIVAKLGNEKSTEQTEMMKKMQAEIDSLKALVKASVCRPSSSNIEVALQPMTVSAPELEDEVISDQVSLPLHVCHV